jgi:cytochrome b subunit of formate dehydrogenase
MLPTWQDVRAPGTCSCTCCSSKEKPAFGKYNFEQKVTYWFIFFGIGILGLSGFILWFPEFFTRFLPGGLVPAAKLAHSTEAIVMVIFIFIWHFYHVHIERLNVSIFNGWLNEEDMCSYHPLEYQRLMGKACTESESGEKKS